MPAACVMQAVVITRFGASGDTIWAELRGILVFIKRRYLCDMKGAA